VGTWGYGLFQDDQATDMRADWKRLYAAFQEPGRATEELVATWRDSLEDADVGPELWIVVAILNHQYGSRDTSLRDKALGIMESGEGLTLWEDQGPREVAARRREYARVRARLLSPPPPLKKVKHVPLEEPPFKPGDLVCYTFLTGVKVLLWVKEYYRYRGEQLPLFIPLDWHGTQLPTEPEIRRLRPAFLETCRSNFKFNRGRLTRTDDFEGEYPTAYAQLREGQTIPICTEFCMRGFNDDFAPRERVALVPGVWEWTRKAKSFGLCTYRWFEFEARGHYEFELETPDQWPPLGLQARTDLEKLRPKPGPLIAPNDPPDRPQPRPKGVTHEYVQTYLGQSRTRTQPGDLHAMHVRGRGWIFARIIRTDVGSWMGPRILLYVYDALVQSGEPVPPLSPDRLLMPPTMTCPSTPQIGYSRIIERRALREGDVLALHCFGDHYKKWSADELMRPLKVRTEPCGEADLGGIAVLDAKIAAAMGMTINWYR